MLSGPWPTSAPPLSCLYRGRRASVAMPRDSRSSAAGHDPQQTATHARSRRCSSEIGTGKNGRKYRREEEATRRERQIANAMPQVRGAHPHAPARGRRLDVNRHICCLPVRSCCAPDPSSCPPQSRCLSHLIRSACCQSYPVPRGTGACTQWGEGRMRGMDGTCVNGVRTACCLDADGAVIAYRRVTHLEAADGANTIDEGRSSRYRGSTPLLEAGRLFQKLCCCQTTVVEP